MKAAPRPDVNAKVKGGGGGREARKQPRAFLQLLRAHAAAATAWKYEAAENFYQNKDFSSAKAAPGAPFTCI